VVAGDVEDLASLGRALEGCQGGHINLPGSPPLEVNGTTNVAHCAARAGVARLTYLSGASVCEKNAWFPLTRAKPEAQAVIRAAGVPYTTLEPTRHKPAALAGERVSPRLRCGLIWSCPAAPRRAADDFFVFRRTNPVRMAHGRVRTRAGNGLGRPGEREKRR